MSLFLDGSAFPTGDSFDGARWKFGLYSSSPYASVTVLASFGIVCVDIVEAGCGPWWSSGSPSEGVAGESLMMELATETGRDLRDDAATPVGGMSDKDWWALGIWW